MSILIVVRPIVILFLVIQISGCGHPGKSSEILIKGDLYFSFFRVTNLYGLPDSTASRIVKYAETQQQHSLEGDSSFFQVYQLLKKENLLYAPYVELKLIDGFIITLFMDSNDYKKIAPTNYSYLVASKKKIRIKAEARQLRGTIYFCSKVMDVIIADGITGMQSKKFVIEDYR